MDQHDRNCLDNVLFVPLQPAVSKNLLLKIYSLHFSVIFERANLWLKHNPQWKVLSCESAESKLKYSGHGQANTSKSTYTVDKDDKTYYFR